MPPPFLHFLIGFPLDVGRRTLFLSFRWTSDVGRWPAFGFRRQLNLEPWKGDLSVEKPGIKKYSEPRKRRLVKGIYVVYPSYKSPFQGSL